jgi:uncharacterized protein YktA (UPF0223 family)
METMTKSPKKVISDKSEQAQRIIANVKEIAKATAKTEETTKVDETLILKELDEAESTLQLKTIAKKYPVFERIIPNLPDYKSFNALFETLQGCLEPEVTKKVKAPKVAKVPVPSAYGTSVEEMCKKPDLSFKELKAIVNAKGFDKDSAIRTANVTVAKIYGLLKANGFVK